MKYHVADGADEIKLFADIAGLVAAMTGSEPEALD